MSAAKHVVLVGMMGCGKSTVGALVADKLNRPFYDLDDIIEKQQSRSISDIFEADGEAFFRKIETATLKDVLESAVGVIATGGGAFIPESNRDMIRPRGFSIYLKAYPATLVERVQGNTARPLLAHADLDTMINMLLEQRQSAYSSADATIFIDALNPQQVADRVLGYQERYT
jgi:shikimate kinase